MLSALAGNYRRCGRGVVMLLDLDLDGQEGHALHLAHVASRS